MSIIHASIQIEGIPFTRILRVSIRHRPNEHGYITITGEIVPEDAQDVVQRADETTQILVKAAQAEGEAMILFDGGLLHLSVQNEAQYSILTVRGITSSYTQDVQKLSRSYQNGGKTYQTILNEAYAGNGSVQLTIADTAIGALILQMDETNWDFTKRMASRFNAPVITSIKAPKPFVFVGLPPVSTTKELRTTSYSEGKRDDTYGEVTENYMAEGSSAIRQDFSAVVARSYDYVYLGDKIKLNDTQYYVKGVEAELVNGLMQMTYELVGQSAFVAPTVSNINCSGRILMGQVRAVKDDLIQVHLVEIDKDYDGGGDWWFPYSTAYSSNDGSGWYVMPEVGDFVRVMFPSKDEAAGFCASSANKAPLANPRHKSFKAPSGKELLMTDQGLYVICNHQKIFIDLMQDDGIKIVADKNIDIVSSANITVQAAKDVQILAQKQIYMGTPESFVIITPQKISLAAKDVVIT